jgi:hypothetical protein
MVIGPNETHVGNVDASRNSTTCESKDFQTCEIRREELVLLEFSAPRKLGNLSWCSFNELAKCLGPLLVDASSKALPLSSNAMRIAVCLDEANVAFDRRAKILDPVAL